ncbi:MAG: helix-turn-helix transcriptional regulator [Rhizobiaceae bacterium]|nr:helix-turn-helix transcriptional regulator [Rhizobiaceae bacterium]
MSDQPGVTTLDDVAKGRSGRSDGNAVIEIQPGFYLGRTDIAIAEGVSYSSRSFPFAGLSILLEGRIATDAPGLSAIEPNTVLCISHNESRELTSYFHGAERLRNVEIFLLPDWYEQPGNHLVDDPTFQEIREAMDRPLRQMRRPLDARFRELALSTLNLGESGAIAALRLEAQALDLLAGLVGSFRDAHAPSNLSRRDFDRMMAVRDAIEGDPASVESLTALAAAHGVSASKLKRDFFLAFSTCVGGFVNEQRLVLARRLLEEGMNVSQAAYRVGYAHPTNFSTAFKRRYGVAPRDIRG